MEELVTSNNEYTYVARFPRRSCKIPAANLVRLFYGSCMQDCVLYVHIRILHGCKTCKKSCKGRLERLLQGLVRLWPLLLQYARFLSKYKRFFCKMCQTLMQASLQASGKSLTYGYYDVSRVVLPSNYLECYLA